MIRHHFTLQRIADELHTLLAGAVLIDCYTQEKQSCVLRFGKRGTDGSVHDSDLAVEIHTDSSLGTVFTIPHTARSRKNSLDVFPSCIGKICKSVYKIATDREIVIDFDSVQLRAQLYSGGTGNVLLFSKGLVQDALQKKQSALGNVVQPTNFSPTLGKWYQKEEDLSGNVEERCRETRSFYVITRDEEILFSLIPLHGWTIEHETSDIFEALRLVYSRRKRLVHLTNLRKQLLQKALQKKTRIEKQILAISEHADQSSRADLYRDYANTLLSHSNPTESGLTEITLPYSEPDEITIPLHDKMTIVENANLYFKKCKEAVKSGIARTAKIPEFEGKLKQAIREISVIEQAETVKDLERLMKNNEKEQQAPATKFRHFELPGGFEVFVGRNSASNDELTMRFANQNDLWFHARGVSGSHVVLRIVAGADKPSKKIIESAASIAAYYSGARNAKYVPVAYTEKKNVRKFKGANVGAVRLEREQVVMVPPAIPQPDGE